MTKYWNYRDYRCGLPSAGSGSIGGLGEQRAIVGELTQAPLSPQVEAVLAAAEAWIQFSCADTYYALKDAVVAYRTLQPKACKPEEAPLGCWFQFEATHPGRAATGPFQLFSLYGNARMYLDANNEAYDFNQVDRIIPIPGDAA